ncbi:exosome nuclease subunit [Coemansia sp. RSA 1807]|nr:exosome nuclease subunit [Coemansia sp. RSA 788]KAJ2202628.1 exosome nuclease subunit [Coemansia sp. RSA 521]KAJ2274995.1 exosome nuclease subunit [Coemansia sp. RSA 370]KAJ2294332.1 exosome nuclease subunit [Coemansia sp. RSA 355]KAJ2575197.1 exosome nuclease subunit [Coemansia sp. RSA 1807]
MAEAFVENFDGSLAAAFSALVKATKAAGRLPNDIAFHRTLDESIDKRLSRTSDRMLRMGNALWMQSRPDSSSIGIDSIDDVAVEHDGRWQTGPRFRPVIDAVDTLLEKIDIGLDEVLKTSAHKLRTAATAQMGKQSAPVVTTIKSGNNLDYTLMHAQNIPRPQLAFKDTVDNSPNTPFVWKIRNKVHARVPLDYGLPSAKVADSPLGHHLHSLGIARPGSTPPSGATTPRGAKRAVDMSNVFDAMSAAETGSLASLPHPYEYEISHYETPEWMLAQSEPQKPVDWDNTPFQYVDTPEQLHAMMEHLHTAREVAIDLEHHDYRSYQGFTCLIQISTRSTDFVVDALALRAELNVLNEVTADPNVIKVFHGAESDIVWLQRDFGVYVVGLFDTYHASKVLNMQHHSLAHLLLTYSAFHADKKYQLADWRIRPIPQEMLAYARADTHFLLYVFDRMRTELLDRGQRLKGVDMTDPDGEHFGMLAGIDLVESATQPLNVVVHRSQQTALKKHVKEGYDAEHGMGTGGWAKLAKKWRHPFTPTQLSVFRALHEWRDSCAREEDESVRYVLPNHMLFNISDTMPEDTAGLFRVCHRTPPPVRLYALDIVRLIGRARTRAEARMDEFREMVRDVESEGGEPVHVRFDEEVDIVDVPDVLTSELIKSVDNIVAPTSSLFGTRVTANAESQAAVRAREIRANLVLTVAVPIRVETKPTEPEFTPIPAKPPTVPKSMMVLSESHAPSVPLPAHKPRKSSDVLDLSKIVLSEVETSDAPEPTKKSRKRTRVAKPETTPNVEAFEYDGMERDAIGESTIDVNQPKKVRHKKQKKSFDPYKTSDSKFDKRPTRSRVNTKSGNRTVSYKK